MKFLNASNLARAVGVHPNTVRRYVDRGILPPVECRRSGYRRFTRRCLDCLRLARQVYGNQHPGKAIDLSGGARRPDCRQRRPEGGGRLLCPNLSILEVR